MRIREIHLLVDLQEDEAGVDAAFWRLSGSRNVLELLASRFSNAVAGPRHGVRSISLLRVEIAQFIDVAGAFPVSARVPLGRGRVSV